jgi:PAS domain S-box-containing protein
MEEHEGSLEESSNSQVKEELKKLPGPLKEQIEKHTADLKKEISDSKKIEEAKYSALVENSKDGVVIIQDGVLNFANKAAMTMVDSTLEEMIGSNFLTWVAEENHELVKKRYADRMAGKDVPAIYEVLLHRSDDSTIPVEVSATLIEYEGKPADLVFIRDISERRRAQEALRKSEERLIAFMESAPDVFALLDSDLNLVEINRVGLKTMFPFGTKYDDIKGKDIGELIPQLKENGMYDRYLEVIKSGRSFSADNLVLHPSFGEQYLSLKAFKVGEGIGIIARNITERKQMEEALRESEERLKTIFSSLDDLVFVLDKNGVFMDYFQPSKLSEVYVPPREFLGKPYREIMPPTVVKLMEDAEEKLLATNEVQQFDYPLSIGGKKLWFSAKVSVREDNAGNFAGYTLVARNITERKKAEKEIMRLVSAMRMSTDCIIISDIEGNIVDANDATLKLYGIEDKEELIGKSSFEFLLPGAEEKALVLMEELLENGRLENQEIEAVFKDDKMKTLEVSISLIKDSEGNVTGTVGITRDITERKRDERKLKKQRNRLKKQVKERWAELQEEIEKRKQAEEALKEIEGKKRGFLGKRSKKSEK